MCVPKMRAEHAKQGSGHLDYEAWPSRVVEMQPAGKLIAPGFDGAKACGLVL